MAILYNATIKAARAAAFISEAGASAVLRVYAGTQPTTGGAAPSGALLSSHVCAATIGTYTGGAVVFNAIGQATSAAASGTPGFVRILKSDGTTWVSDIPVSGMGATVAGQAYAINTSSIVLAG